MLLRNREIVSGIDYFIKMKCWHSFPQSLMGSDKRPTDVSKFPEGIHRISYACSPCFHISGDGKRRLSVHVSSSMMSTSSQKHLLTLFLLIHFHTEAHVTWKQPQGRLAWPGNSVCREADMSRQSEKQNRHMPYRNLTCSPPRQH